MINGLITIVTFLSAIYFPWPFTALLALLGASVEPLLPLAAGLFADTLYYTPALGFPYFTCFGALVTLLAFFVRSRLRTGSM